MYMLLQLYKSIGKLLVVGFYKKTGFFCSSEVVRFLGAAGVSDDFSVVATVAAFLAFQAIAAATPLS